MTLDILQNFSLYCKYFYKIILTIPSLCCLHYLHFSSDSSKSSVPVLLPFLQGWPCGYFPILCPAAPVAGHWTNAVTKWSERKQHRYLMNQIQLHFLSSLSPAFTRPESKGFWHTGECCLWCPGWSSSLQRFPPAKENGNAGLQSPFDLSFIEDYD